MFHLLQNLNCWDFISPPQNYEEQIELILNDCLILPLNNSIKQHYKALRKSYKLKLADSLVAATALGLNIPLVTADKEFKKIKSLNLIQNEK